MKRLAVVLCMLGFLTPGAVAQAQTLVGISYATAYATGNTADFIDEFSWRGMGFDFRRYVSTQASMGFYIGWNVLHEETNETTQLPDQNGAISGKQFRYTNAFPFLFESYYHLGRHGQTRPYFGGGIGAYRLENRVEVGVFAVEERNWHFGVAPEAGILMPISYDAHWFVNARYNYAFSSGRVDDQSYWSFSIGVTSDADVF